MKKIILIMALVSMLFIQGCGVIPIALSAAAAYGISQAFK